VSYIDKNSNVVISARMTNEGRKLLSLGLLNFDTFRLGDSEIDYLTLGTSYDVSLENIIRAKAENPDLKTPLKPTTNATSTYLTIPRLDPVILNTLVTAPKIGFFEYSAGTIVVDYTASTDTICHTLQSDAIIPISGITGSTYVKVLQAPTYGSNTYEPKVGDLMMVKMGNDEYSLTSQTIVETVPYLWYKVQSLTGSLSANTLQVGLDRNFAKFPSYVGSNYCWATFYPLGDTTTSDYLFSDGGFYSGGCVWNMNNVWTYPMIGVNPASYENFDKYGSESYVGTKEYLGYTTEKFISGSSCNLVPSISIIHYTNKETCSNPNELKYGQKFYIDTLTTETPKLIMPTLMWHRDTIPSMGHIFIGSGDTEYVTISGNTPYVPSTVSTVTEKNIYYTPLVDNYGNKVGRIFPELQIFSIDDQELVAALSYKSNRNWTLPTPLVDTVSSVDGVVDGTEILYLTYLLASNSGYTTGLHCQNFICVNTVDLNGEGCSPILKQAVNVQLPDGQFPYMAVTGGTGWYADKFYILAQKQPYGTYPQPEQWVSMDFTSEISGHVVGNRINPINLTATNFQITQSKYSSGSTYNLNDYIKIPQIAQTNNLQFGDERFLFGNIEATGVSSKYRTKFVFTIPPNQFNTSTNPTWSNGNTIHISEVGIYDVNKNLVAIGKMNVPIEKVSNSTIIIEIAFDL
jgi:hypothetical protein